MDTVTSESELRKAISAWRDAGEIIGFVPTMGALHEGHLSLVRLAREAARRIVVSVFVNPTQFGPGEDFESYPRDPQGDAAKLAEAGADLLFLPTVDTMYPEGAVTRVRLDGPPAEGLEAAHRPGHFEGVATVVTQLLQLVQPDVAVFGRKDAQQLAVVRRLVRDLHMPVSIVPGETVREADGLALSSRNAYLSEDERTAATVLFRALETGSERIREGERNASNVRATMRDVLMAEPRARVDYAEVVDAATFLPVDQIEGAIVLPLAVHIGETRLIDNIHLELEERE
jgi:pantoate--beta-alanine ligase